MRTFHTLVTLDLGFDRDKILIVRVEGEQSQVPADRRAALNERVREAVGEVPGVARAVLLRTVPISPDHWVANVEIPGRTPPAGASRTAFLNSVSPGWFEMFGTPMLVGREFDDHDRPGSPLVAVVNEAFARQFASGQNPVGETLRFGGDDELGPPFTIVGLPGTPGQPSISGSARACPQPSIWPSRNDLRTSGTSRRSSRSAWVSRPRPARSHRSRARSRGRLSGWTRI